MIDIIEGVRGLIPPQDVRTPITASTAPYLLIPVTMFVLMAGLARTPGTWALRLALLPFAVAINLRIMFGLFFKDPYYAGLNHALGELRPVWTLLVLFGLIRLTSWGYVVGSFGVISPPFLVFLAMHREGVLKINEIAPGVVKSAPRPKSEGEKDCAPSDSSVPLSQPPESFSFRSFFARALELLSNTRGVGWKFGTGTGVYVAKDTRDLSNRSAFLRQTLYSIIWHIMILDTLNSVLARSDLRRPRGTVFGRGKNPIESLAISTFLTLATGSLLLFGGYSSVILDPFLPR